MTPTLAALKTQLIQLNELHASGGLPDTSFEQARRELERRIADAVLADEPLSTGNHAESGTSARLSDAMPLRHWLLLGAAAVLCAGAGYGGVTLLKQQAAAPVASLAPDGRPSSLSSMASGQPTTVPLPSGATATPHDTGADQITAMVERLAQKMKDKPTDAEGWAMLARSYGVLGRQAESLAAYEKALALRKNDPVLQADYAKALAAKTGSTQPKL